MDVALALVGGLAWTIVYLDCIRVGFRDRTYAIPAAALALNFAWESINGVYALMVGGLSVQAVITLVWAALDIVTRGCGTRAHHKSRFGVAEGERWAGTARQRWRGATRAKRGDQVSGRRSGSSGGDAVGFADPDRDRGRHRQPAAGWRADRRAPRRDLSAR